MYTIRHQFLNKILLITFVFVFQQHFTIRQLEIDAECVCNGQDLGCIIDNISHHFTCVCGANTAGTHCETCAPLYNQLVYTYGQPCQREDSVAL